MEQEKETKTVNKKAWTAWIAIAVGIAAIVLGSIGITEDDETNSAIVDLGVTMTITNTVEQYPDSVQQLAKVSQVIDSVLDARNGNMEDLSALLEVELNKITNASTTDAATIAVTRIIKLINQAYTKSETEEVFIQKLRFINSAIKENLGIKEEPKVEEETTPTV